MDNTIRRVLILGGSAEGFALAEALANVPDLETITSFAGRTKNRRSVAGEFRVGGFGGTDGLAEYIKAQHIAAVIDATHPFANNIKRNAARAAAIAGTPLVHISRPPWRSQPGDDWRDVPDMATAAQAVPDNADPTFLTVGRSELAAFACRPDIHFLARVIDPPERDTGIARLTLLYDRGPFSYARDLALLRTHKVQALVTKNSGGDAAVAKLQAARELNIPVIMVARPTSPDGQIVTSPQEAAAWLAARLEISLLPASAPHNSHRKCSTS